MGARSRTHSHRRAPSHTNGQVTRQCTRETGWRWAALPPFRKTGRRPGHCQATPDPRPDLKHLGRHRTRPPGPRPGPTGPPSLGSQGRKAERLPGATSPLLSKLLPSICWLLFSLWPSDKPVTLSPERPSSFSSGPGPGGASRSIWTLNCLALSQPASLQLTRF